MDNPLNFSGKVVIVTGGARGVGRGITTRFLEAGADVVICDIKEPETLPSAGGKQAVYVDADIRSVEEIDKVVKFTTERCGRLDILVNNAGGSPPADAATASPRFSEAIIRLNLIAPLNFAQTRQRGHAAAGRRRVHHQHRQRERHPSLTRHGGVRRGQGGGAEPHARHWRSSGLPRSGSTR